MLRSRNSSRYRQFSNALRRVREDRSITQVQLAKRLRVTQSWISKVERGERRLDIVELEIWCKAVGITLHEFVAAF